MWLLEQAYFFLKKYADISMYSIKDSSYVYKIFFYVL